MTVRVERAAVAELPPLLELWERSVRATHHFLTDADVAALRPLVAEELAGDAVEWWVARDDAGTLLGFLGYARDAIEALFLDPAHRGRRVGRHLVDHAHRLGGGTLAVDVNEQNEAAVGFYEAVGFTVVSRSATDAGGRPFPILHMRRTTSRPSGTSGAVTTPMTTPCTIELATPADVPTLAGIELAAARLLAGHASETFLAETTSVEAFEAARAAGHLWVARVSGAPVGFAHVTLREPGVAHLEELDVHPAHGRRGIGRRLVTTVCEWAAREGFRAVTLTTFRDVPFNMPFYRALGFEVLSPEELGPAVAATLEAEARAGLERRVGMRRMSSA